MLQQLSCFWQMFGNPSLLISFFCGCRFTCAVSTHLLQVASFPLKCLCWRCWLDTQREGNRASSSHLSHNMPGHHSKSHTNTLRPLARTLPYKNTPMQVAVRSLVLSFWPCLSKHNLLAGVLHCAICFFCFFLAAWFPPYIWLLSGYHTFCLWFHMCNFSRKGILWHWIYVYMSVSTPAALSFTILWSSWWEI